MLQDATLIDQAVRDWQAGIDCEENFGRLFEAFFRPVHQFFRRRGLSAEESRDLTQDTFVRVYHGIATFRREAPFEAWLFQVAANVLRNALRATSARKRAGTTVSWDDTVAVCSRIAGGTDRWSPEPLDDVLMQERQGMLRSQIAALPAQMRRCLVLRVYQDLSYEEIAFVLRLSIDTVKAHLFQARRHLRERMAPHLQSGV